MDVPTHDDDPTQRINAVIMIRYMVCPTRGEGRTIHHLHSQRIGYRIQLTRHGVCVLVACLVFVCRFRRTLLVAHDGETRTTCLLTSAADDGARTMCSQTLATHSHRYAVDA